MYTDAGGGGGGSPAAVCMYVCLPTSLKMSRSHSPSHAGGTDPMPPAPMLCRRRRCYAADAMPPAPMLCRRTHCCYVWGGGRCSLIKCQLSTGNLGLPPPSPPHTTAHTWDQKLGPWIPPPSLFLGYVFLCFLYFCMGSHWHKITNGTINYMGLGIMIFRRGIDITWGIGWPVLGPGIALAYLGAKMPLGWRLVAFNGPNS